MRILFLGTGAAEGIPALFCDCVICAGARARGGADLRTRCSILIDDAVKIDLPPDTLAHVHAYPERMRLFALRHLLFTHSHDDHFAVRELQYLSPNFAPHRQEPLNVYAADALIKKMQGAMGDFFEKSPVHVRSIAPFVPFVAGHLEVMPIAAHHKKDEVCVNYILRSAAEDRTVLYGSDTGWYDPSTWDEIARHRVDAVILECGKGNSENEYDGHLSIREAAAMREEMIRLGATQASTPFYLTHIAHTGGLLHAEMAAMVAPLGMQVACDGLEIVV